MEPPRATELAQAHDDLAGFAGRAAHDLQGPLGVIEGWAAELAALVHDEEAAAIVERIRAAAAEARALVGSMLADALAGDRAPATERVDLTALAHDLAEAHADHADVVVLEVGVVPGDPVQLRQLLGNLLDNAVKYVGRGERPQVTVSGAAYDGELRVTVADRGIGIPPGEHERIFGELERATTDYPGTGLGLSICRRIAERHGGRISARDRDDDKQGAVFEVVLPAGPTKGDEG